MFKYIGYMSLPSALLLAACASRTPANLRDARAAYKRAANGPAAQLTPAQLHAAQTSLAVAEQTYDDEGDSANTRDRAYVAERKAQLAEVQASIVAADQQTVLAAKRLERDQARNQAQTEEALNRTRAELEREKQQRREAEQRAAEALSALAGIGSVKQESRGTVITLSGAVIFASGKSELLPGARAKLDQVATALMQGDPKSKIVVEGHTDSRGSAALNQDLSTRRAETVRNYLVSKGVPAERISSEGFGATHPIADNDTAEGRANNRRVEIVVGADTLQQQSSTTPNVPGASNSTSTPGK